jgi:acyl-CoA synthetase (AMP-forming)/AMP-acid ligase II|tara:strand:- start:1959 stop:2657 length:699 start_codon:yes stop_codon:yes gene_type:complete
MIDYATILQHGVEISSSGTTGEPKTILRTPDNLQACNDVAIDAQQLTRSSKVLTVTRITHAGGLLAQTLPAYSIGAEFKVQQFNAFSFLKDFKDYTHTFLAPAQMTALMNTKGFKDCDLTGKRILGGSDSVTWEMIESFVSKGAIVQPNWGMSEIGPIVINIEFDSMDKVQYVKERTPDEYTIMGDTYYCDWKIIDHELYVKGPTSIYNDWYATGDIVALDMGKRMYYLGRK